MAETNPIVQGLATIHKIISRGLNISIRKCDEYLSKKGIPQGETTGFYMYLSTLKKVTHAHHLSEDDVAFPYFMNLIEAPYDRLKDDHQKIASILETLDKHISEIPSSGVGKLREVLLEIEKLWVPHIIIEEENLTAEKLNKVIGIKEQADLTEKLSRHGRENSGPGPLTLPFMIYNLEGNDREAFTKPFPWILKKVLIPIIWKGQWKPMSPFFL